MSLALRRDTRTADVLLGRHRQLEERRAPVKLAAREAFFRWVTGNHFVADREPIDFTVWRFLRAIYATVPEDLTGFDWVIKKSAQGGASIFAMLLALFTAIRGRVQLAYFLPTHTKALDFSANRFIRLARENKPIHALFGDPETPHNRQIVDEGSASIRRILHSLVYFSSLEGKVSTESNPLDGLIFDEVQEMLLAAMEKALERIAASPMKLRLMLSTANFVGADIDYWYERSDQRTFFTKCRCKDGIILAEAWDPRSGPLCIGEGSGATPGVPRGYFYRCPRCDRTIADPQDGAFRARNPGHKRVGWHFPQMLSPRQTAASIMDKWLTRVDTKNFYNRILGLAYTDPDTQPVSEQMLREAQDPTLAWGPPVKREQFDGVFMGLDQMGHDIHVVITAKTTDRARPMRLIHVEVIQDENPWRRAGELMRLYRVRYCGVEALPNFNEAHRFAKAFEKRVFVVYYQDHLDEVLTWGDRPREKVTIRRTDDDFKTRYTVSADQYKLMSLALGYWAQGLVETPDGRTLIQRMRTDQGDRRVPIITDPKLGFWLHMQRVALVTELPEGREDERKPRRAVKKVGIDPHFAYAWMLMMVAWARAYGTALMVGGGPEMTPDERVRAMARERGRAGGVDPGIAQVVDAMPEKFDRRVADPEALTCGDCANFDPDTSKCRARQFYVAASMDVGPCPVFVPLSDEEADWT